MRLFACLGQHCLCGRVRKVEVEILVSLGAAAKETYMRTYHQSLR